MAPSILIVGATANTGQYVVSQLSKLLESKNFDYRIIGLTRSLDSALSEKLSKLPGVEMLETD